MILEHLFTQENSGTPYSGVSVFMVSNEYVNYLDNEARWALFVFYHIIAFNFWKIVDVEGCF